MEWTARSATPGQRKLRRRDGTLRIGAFWPYSRTLLPSLSIAQRNPDVLELGNHVEFAQALEDVGLDFALIADGYAPASEAVSRTGFQDPSTNATIVSVPLFLATTHLGIISTMHTTFLHPVVIARLGAHLDWISGGRWGWNIVNGFRDHEARLFGLEKKVDDGYALAQEAVDIATALWQRTPEAVTYEGQHFKVDGKMRRPVPSTLPLLVSAAASGRGRAFAAANCDYLFTSALTKEVVQDTAAGLQRDAAQAGREAPRILILADILIRDTPGTAQQLYADLIGSADPEAQKTWASHLSKIGDARPNAADLMTLLGTPEEVAEQIIALHRASDLTGGFALRMLLWGPEEARRLAPVLALLQKAGIWTPPASRDHCW